MKTVAIIPVRGGSKSIPLKNIKLMNGRPLVYWTIDAALNCNWIDTVYVSTDSDVIRDCVESYDRDDYGKLRCISRNQRNATDSASTESVLFEFIEKVESDNLVLLQATSPLTEAKHLNEAFKIFIDENFDSLLSVVEQKRFIWEKSFNGNQGKPINYNPENRPRRQEYDGYLVENGAFYITKTTKLMESKVRISGNIGIYEMPEETYFEIDELSDWIIVEQLLKIRELKNKKQSKIKLFATDCDGVLTDAGMYYNVEGDMLKKFNTKDGMGFAMLRDKGIKTAILTGENSPIVARRAEKLRIDDVYLGCVNKVEAMKELLEKYNISFDEVAYIGDDINDLPLLEKVGLSFSVNDAMESVKNIVDVITSTNGGDGAVREAIEYIINGKEYCDK